MKTGHLIAAVIVIAVIALALGATIGYSISSGRISTTTVYTASISSSSCYYVLPQPVPCLIGQNFTLSVNYTGHWELFYQGWNCLGKDCGITTTNGSYTGTGFSSGTITVQGAGNGWTLCAQAEKLDSSTPAITLTIGGAVNSTTLALGSVSACDETQLV